MQQLLQLKHNKSQTGMSTEACSRTADQQSVWGWADSAENQNESSLLHLRCLTAVSHCFGMQGIPIFLQSRLNERTAHHQYPDIARGTMTDTHPHRKRLYRHLSLGLHTFHTDILPFPSTKRAQKR